MPIQTGDIELVESDTMSDVDQGGGAMTSNVIVDGESNNIFEDISTLDRVYGAVHMRKVFPRVNIQTQDKYFGSHLIISKLPKDEKIGINLFNTKDWFDRRPEAASRVENYRAKGSKYNGFLWATQYTGSKVLTIYQAESSPKPGISDVLFLTNSAQTKEQYVKITEYDEELQWFTDASGTYSRLILTLVISQPLDYDFVGAEMSRIDPTPDATINNTVVANAAKYFSARYLAEAGSTEDLSVKVDDVYSQVIPSSLQELAITDADMNGISAPLYDSATNTSLVVITTLFAANTSFYMGSPILPGTLSIPVSGGTLVDDGGSLKIGETGVGTVNYIEGSISFISTAPSYSGTKNCIFKPASAPVKIADTNILDVTAANRGFVWVNNISPPPLPGSLQVSYRALGEWYNLYDDGGGAINGSESGIGTGTISYITGSLSLTLSAMPDADSAILFSWGQPARYNNRSDITPDPLKIIHQLVTTGIAPNTLVVTWNDGVARTATADVYGVLSGDAIGNVNHASGLLELQPNLLPLGGTQFTIDYDKGSPLSKTFNGESTVGGVVTLDLSDVNIVPNSLEVTWNVEVDKITYKHSVEVARTEVDANITAKDDGAGLLHTAAGQLITSSDLNYTTGILIFNPDFTRTIKVPILDKVAGEWSTSYNTLSGRAIRVLDYTYEIVGYTNESVPAIYPLDGSGVITVKYRKSDSEVTQQEIVTMGNMEIDLTTGFDEYIIPTSVRFVLGGDTYIDREGSLYYDIDPDTGAGSFGGTVDYTTGNISLTNWTDGLSNAVTLESLATDSSKEPVGKIAFRIPSAPVKVDSVQIRAVTESGVQLNIIPESTGLIEGGGAEGFCNYETGVIMVSFGSWVTAAGNEGEPWYDADAVADGEIFKTDRVFADTVFYNAVSQTFLPLDKDILGLDPVRLPQDGRIPVFADGDVVVILHDNSSTFTPIQDEVTTLTNLLVTDNNGDAIVSPNIYTADYNGSTLTWVDVAGVAMPVTISDQRGIEIPAATYVNSEVVGISTLDVSIRGRLSKLIVRDSANQTILSSKYTADLDAGVITFTDTTGISMPVTITDRIEDMSVLSDVQITGTLELTQPLTHNFPVAETLVSNAVIYGDLYAHTSIPFDQSSWTGVWSDSLIGSETAAQYNNTQFPITVDNSNCIEERWYAKFTSSTVVNIIGENVGQILTSVSILSDIAPINPNTGQPFFTIPLGGWGAGWASGNILRFNTYGANHPTWLIQSVNQGEATDPDFNFCIEVRGDIDTIV